MSLFINRLSHNVLTQLVTCYSDSVCVTTQSHVFCVTVCVLWYRSEAHVDQTLGTFVRESGYNFTVGMRK